MERTEGKLATAAIEYPPPTHAAAEGASHRNYLLMVLMVIQAFNHVDRHALGLLLQDIKLELQLSDTQLGLLTGIAFSLFYSVMGVPIARWADRGNRVTIIAVTTALWSAAVAACAAAGSFMQLMMIRVGVAVGEAGCVPPAHSLIADYFNRADRARAVSRYMLGVPLSLLIGFFLAGWINEFYGWRATFVALGLPGVVLSAVAWFTLKEPRLAAKSREVVGSTDASDAPSLATVASTLWANRTFRHVLFGFSISSFFGYGIVQWKAAFFMRSFGLQTGELGTWFAMIYSVCGALGVYISGEWASRHAAHNERLQLKAMGLAYVVFGAVSCCIYLSQTKSLAFFLLALATVGIYTINGPLFAVIQSLVPSRMRAMSMALIFFFANLVGMGFGPLLAGILSDALRTYSGEESLRYALLALCPGYFWAGYHLWRASQTVEADIKAAQAEVQVHV